MAVGRIIFGLIMVVIGAVFVIYANKFYDAIGPIPWAEEHLGTEGGSRLMYKLIGIGISIVGFLIMTNLLANILLGIIKALFPGFVEPVPGA